MTAGNVPAEGRFITFEGGEGAGKSTQIARLASFLQAAGIPVEVTREPGGSPAAETIRRLLLTGKVRALGPQMEAAMFAAARADHMDERILPALAAGHWVLCDRFADSTRVYQGEAGVDPAFLDQLEALAIMGRRPDLTVLIDVPPEVGLARVRSRKTAEQTGDPDRFEAEETAVHARRRALFLDLAKAQHDRFIVIDGALPAEAVAREIREGVEHRFADDLRRRAHGVVAGSLAPKQD